jgi:hypothetical protein
MFEATPLSVNRLSRPVLVPDRHEGKPVSRHALQIDPVVSLTVYPRPLAGPGVPQRHMPPSAQGLWNFRRPGASPPHRDPLLPVGRAALFSNILKVLAEDSSTRLAHVMQTHQSPT